MKRHQLDLSVSDTQGFRHLRFMIDCCSQELEDWINGMKSSLVTVSMASVRLLVYVRQKFVTETKIDNRYCHECKVMECACNNTACE